MGLSELVYKKRCLWFHIVESCETQTYSLWPKKQNNELKEAKSTVYIEQHSRELGSTPQKTLSHEPLLIVKRHPTDFTLLSHLNITGNITQPVKTAVCLLGF